MSQSPLRRRLSAQPSGSGIVRNFSVSSPCARTIHGAAVSAADAPTTNPRREITTLPAAWCPRALFSRQSTFERAANIPSAAVLRMRDARRRDFCTPATAFNLKGETDMDVHRVLLVAVVCLGVAGPVAQAQDRVVTAQPQAARAKAPAKPWTQVRGFGRVLNLRNPPVVNDEPGSTRSTGIG